MPEETTATEAATTAPTDPAPPLVPDAAPVLIAKMFVNGLHQRPDAPGSDKVSMESVSLSAVSGEANKPWSKWTPEGQLNLTITNPDAVGQLKLGGFYKVLLVPCGKDD